jgi:hypothetical protein
MKRVNLPGALSLALALTLLPVVTLAAACDGDSSTPAGTQDAGPTKDTGGGTDTAAPPCDATPDLTGKVFLVDSIVIEEPDDQMLLDALNPLFATDIASGALVMLFHVTAWDPATGVAQVDVGNGVLDAGNYVWDGTANQLELNVDKCAFTMSTESSLQLKPATVNKPIIVSGLLVDGRFAADASALPDAHIVGAIKRSDADGLEVTIGTLPPVELDDLFDSFGLIENADTNKDGTPDGWKLTGTITGTAVTNVSLN